MTNSSLATVGVIGMAVMGSNLARNLARKGYTVALYNRTTSKTDAVVAEHGEAVIKLILSRGVEHGPAPTAWVTAAQAADRAISSPPHLGKACCTRLTSRRLKIWTPAGRWFAGSPQRGWPRHG